MVFWSVIFVFVSIVMILGNFPVFAFPATAYQIFPLLTLLGSLGLLYRTLYKIRSAEKENYRLEIYRLKSELEDYKRRIIRGETETQIQGIAKK